MSQVLLAAYATGIVVALYGAPPDATGLYVFTGILLALLALALVRRSPLAWAPLLVLLALTGFLNASHEKKPPASANHISRFADHTPRIVEGTILSLEHRADGGCRLLVEVRQVGNGQQFGTVSGKLLLYVKNGSVSARPGQIIRWRSRLRRPQRYGNPGEFDYPLYLAAQGVHVTAYVEQAADLVTLVNHPHSSSRPLENLRCGLAAHIGQVVPPTAAGYLQALLLGMRSGISDDQKQVIAASGVAHLFTISGLHFGLLAMMLFLVGKWLYTRSERLTLWCPPQRALPTLLLLPLLGYLLLTGNAWATRRAFLMVAAVALLLTRNRRTSPFALLSSVALCLLLFNPLALFQAGFQLSFAGVAGILAWLPRWQKAARSLPVIIRWPLTLMATTAAATLATMPANLWFFHQLSPAGLLSNLIAIPLIAWGAVPVGLLSLAILPLSNLAADIGLWLASTLVTTALDLVTRISQWPWCKAIPCYLTTTELVLLTGTLLVFLPLSRSRHRLHIRLAILLVTLTAAWLFHPGATPLRVVAISVGQGDATLLSFPHGEHFLVDGGGMPGTDFDTGERLVGPALGRLGVKRLHGVILTHNHPDHSSGLTTILRRFPVDGFFSALDISDLPPELQEVLQQKNITVHHLDQGWTEVYTDGPQSLSLYAPSQRSQDMNERSVAVYARQGETGALLTADLGKTGLQQLGAAGIPGRVGLLKLPHHGSRHAHPELYLGAFQPEMAFVSSGRDNVYGFPHPQTIAACAENGVALFRTDQDGMLVFSAVQDHWQASVASPF